MNISISSPGGSRGHEAQISFAKSGEDGASSRRLLRFQGATGSRPSVTRHPSPLPRRSEAKAFPAIIHHPSSIIHRSDRRAFTMIEIAISLAVIGIALVAIVGVLPLGMSVQRENREGTIINQDATVLMEAIRNGARGMNDLTNYVYAITNYWTEYDNKSNYVAGNNGANGVNNGYSYPTTTIAPGYVTPSGTFTALATTISNGTNIVGLLSTPEFTDKNGAPINNFLAGNFYSNHIVAYVRSISGPAVEKPPQDNQILQEDTFSYRVLCVNAPVASYTAPLWLKQSYNAGDTVSYILNGQITYWQAVVAFETFDNKTLPPQSGDEPSFSIRWVRAAYPEQLAQNLHELRLTFLWPQQPNGKLGTGRQTYRTLVAGQMTTNAIFGPMLYFYQPQSFAITK
jgi:prepilin-type N-terminal cleavage/methylation domain-containing protein